MKTVAILILALSFCSLAAEPEKQSGSMLLPPDTALLPPNAMRHWVDIPKSDVAPLLRVSSADAVSLLTLTMAKKMVIACGKGQIEINLETGEVKLPEGVSLDEAAVQFWLAVWKAFPEARRQAMERQESKREPR